MRLILPSVFAIDEVIAGNPIQQVAELGRAREGTLPSFTNGRVRGHLFRPTDGSGDILLIPRARPIVEGQSRVISAVIDADAHEIDLSDSAWLRHPVLANSITPGDHAIAIQKVLDSWRGAFHYCEEDEIAGRMGLRTPQLAAIHAVHAHWAVSDSPATIVMPTGTGKTDTMLSILVSGVCAKVLVVVPTDALRKQLAAKFLTLGILRAPDCTVLASAARYPVVCTLRHIPRDIDAVNTIFERAQVIVTTSSIAGQCEPNVQKRMSEHCRYLFIDEAHHTEAPTWTTFKDRFVGRRVLQFTATPFREDARPLDGKIIFRYPLRRAQQDGYFRPIRFRSVNEFDQTRADEAIAAQAVEQLRIDDAKGHVVMARVDSVARAEEVYDIYSRYPEFNPVQLHSGVKSATQRENTRRQIVGGKARIVVCVDMLGEGFDLPELKIAAFHDIRKSLAVTLQLAGRFTRARKDLGDATFVANTADVNVREELRKLYSQDPDWNELLPELNDALVGEQLSLQEFLGGFSKLTDEIPIRALRPATSAVVYRTTCHDWTPEAFRRGIPAIGNCHQVRHAINREMHTLVAITVRRTTLEWSDIDSLYAWQWDLYVVVWSPEQNLLYINGSSNAGDYRKLAEAVAGDTASIIRGDQVFRTLAGINRLKLQNVGLTEQLGRNIRYTGRMGADIEPALSGIVRQRARKSVLAGSGYEAGEIVTVGASRKGRIWSHRRVRLEQLVTWCKHVGSKLLDDGIDPEEVLRGTLEPRVVSERPASFPICVDWPEEMYSDRESDWSIAIDDHEFSLSELNIDLVKPQQDGPLRFAISSDDRRAELVLVFDEEDEGAQYRFDLAPGRSVTVRHGERSDGLDAKAFFYSNPPVIWFADGSSLEGNEFTVLKARHPPFDVNKIAVLDWTGTDIRKESQGADKHPDSVQARIIRELRSGNYDLIVDDDGKGEAADVVTVRLLELPNQPTTVEVEFYHCKYAHGDRPGHRIVDLYEVCGQAQKSIGWARTSEKRVDLFTHLLRREDRRRRRGMSSAFEVGNVGLLREIKERSRTSRVSLKIVIVQPGLSVAEVSRGQLELLGVTEAYLWETLNLQFAVIASA